MNIQALFDYLPPPLRYALCNVSQSFRDHGEEIRIRTDRPVTLISGGKSFHLSHEGALCGTGGIIADRKLIQDAYMNFTEMSPYAYAHELSQGFLSIEGGHRIGFCGSRTGIGIKDISSINIRISRERKGFADCISKSILPLKNILVISPPGAGKTTLLRDMARIISDSGIRVAIADSRFEIGAVHNGTPQLDIGGNTDILSGFPTSDAIMMLLRTMSPEVIVTDEIGGADDAAALSEMIKSGVYIFASAHGRSTEDVRRRLGKTADFFDSFIIIENSGGVRNVYTDC